MAFMTAISAVVGLAGSFMQASAAKQQGEAQAAAAEYNAQVAEQQAAQERDAAKAEGEDFHRRSMAQVSSNRAVRAASGVTMAGSPLMVDEATVREVALGAARKVYAGQVRGTRLENEATLDRFRAGYHRDAGSMAAGATLLTGVSRFAGQIGSMYG